MARKVKKDNALLKRSKQQDMKRKVGGRPVRQFFLIVCEGAKTEPNYFKSVRATLPKGVMEYIEIEGDGRNTLTLIEEINRIRTRAEREQGKKYDQVWAVFDKDSFPDDHFDNAIHKSESQKDKIQCAWSNEAFELWYLLHFEFRNTAMSRDEYRPRIEKHLSEKMGTSFEYKKNREDMYMLLQKFGNEEAAIKHAIELEKLSVGGRYSSHNPCTKVYLLILELNKMKVV
jgi:hypothetical protein